jgi:hypothetical protein
MSSSDGRRRATGESAVAADPGIETSVADAADTGMNGAADHELNDPWFEPGPKLPAYANGDDIGSTTAEWFLPTGRAGLLPDSMTVTADDEADTSVRSDSLRAATSGAPPWAGEAADPAPATPPPWENGPWSGPGSYRASSEHRANGAQSEAGRAASGRAGDAGGLPPPRVILIAGLVPLVVPGLVLGALGFGRSSAGEPARRASVAALAASLTWAVVIIVIIAVSGSGSGAASCTFPTAAQQAYQRAIANLSSAAPKAVRAGELGAAVSTVNSSAAAASQIPVRSALAAMAGDLEQARSDLAAGRPVPKTLRQHLAADGAALTRACPR